MLSNLLCLYSDGLGTGDAAVGRLATDYKGLVVVGGRVDTKSEAGFNAAARFLEDLDETARALRVEAAPRSYRTSFTINYRALFPDESRSYRVDILEASIEQNDVIWVNGDKFEFSAEAMHCAEALQIRWTHLSSVLVRWNKSTEQPLLSSKPARAELRSTLKDFDIAWALFEKKYINELIQIEEQARQLVVRAIDAEHRLQDLEIEHGLGTQGRPACIDAQRNLVSCVARLNSVANFRRKGRDDLPVEVLSDAVDTLARCDAAEKNGVNTERLAAARMMSTDVVESFDEIRTYLRDVSKCLERVDPHLCNNVGLVAALVDWEESWEIGAKYVQNEHLLSGICDLVAEMRFAQRIAPELVAMCEGVDAELFVVMPRIIWLRGLTKPAAQLAVFKSLLPKRFIADSASQSDGADGVWHCDAELSEFIEKFRSANALLMGNWRSAARISERAAWEILIKRVVNGAQGKDKDDTYSILSPRVRPQAEAAVEELLNKLEGWSMELQRHHAEDWNQFSAVLISCLSGGTSKQRRSRGVFQV